MKNKNIIGIVFSLCSAVFYILAIIGLSSGGNSSTSAIWLCFGSAFLCISTVFNRRMRDDEKKDAEKTGENAEDAADDAKSDASEDTTEE